MFQQETLLRTDFRNRALAFVNYIFCNTFGHISRQAFTPVRISMTLWKAAIGHINIMTAIQIPIIMRLAWDIVCQRRDLRGWHMA